MFENVRSRRKKPTNLPRVVHYDRDIILLPQEFKQPSGDIQIPRSGKRNKLGQAGLVGKMDLNSLMTEEEVRREICEVFAAPMEMTESSIKDGLFSFNFLQRAGAGAKNLCIPAVKESYEWNGKKVASLSKAGGYIYLLADEVIPGWQRMVRENLQC